jgi:hypothetical protein
MSAEHASLVERREKKVDDNTWQQQSRFVFYLAAGCAGLALGMSGLNRAAAAATRCTGVATRIQSLRRL